MDSDNYNRIAGALLRGEGFRLWSRPTTFVAPVYPYFLAGVYAIFGVHFLVVKIIQAVLWAVIVILTYAIGAELFTGRVGMLAAAAVALHPELVAISTYLYTETLFVFLLLLFAKFFIKAWRTRDWRWYAASGIVLGVVTLCRGTTLLLPGVLFILLGLTRSIRENLFRMVVLCLTMAAAIVPWTYRNYVVSGAFIPVATGSGEVFWIGNYLPFDGEYRYEETRERMEELTAGMSLVEKDRVLMREAVRRLREHPFASIKLFCKKAYRFWIRVYENIPRGEQRTRNTVIQVTLTLIHWPLILLAAYGITKSGVRRPEVIFVIGLGLYFTLIHVVTLAVPRYRLPIMPFVLMFSSVGFLQVADFLDRRTGGGHG